MMSKKILFCIDSPGFGGSEINAIKLIYFLKEYYSISLLINTHAPVELMNFIHENKLEYETFYSPNHAGYFFKGILNGLKRIRRSKADMFLVWSHHLNSNRWLQVALAVCRKKFIVVEQLLPTSYERFLKKSKLSIPIKKFIAKRAFANVVCAYSQASNYGSYLKTHKVTVIPNSRPVRKIAEGISALRANIKKRPDIFTVCCVGRLTDQKDQQSVLQAIALLKSKKPLHLLLVGDGENRGKLESMTQQLELKTDIEITGFVADVWPLLAISDIFVLPSLEEGLPGALIEAMAAGLPCIASDIPGNNELVIHQKTGLLVPLHSPEKISEELLYLIENPRESKILAEKGFQHVLQNYDEEIENKMWLNLLQEIA